MHKATLYQQTKEQQSRKAACGCQRQMGVHLFLHLGIIEAGVVIFLEEQMYQSKQASVAALHACRLWLCERQQLHLCSNPSSPKDMGKLGSDCSQADLGMQWSGVTQMYDRIDGGMSIHTQIFFVAS